MPAWISTAIHYALWGVLLWIVLAIGVGILLGRAIRRRDRQKPADVIGYDEVEQIFTTTPPARDPQRGAA